MAQPPRVILDTSVIIAGLISPHGGSAKVIQACCRGTLLCAVSDSTGDEISRNIDKVGGGVLPGYRALLSSGLGVVNPTSSAVDSFTSFTDPDDAHLLAACDEWEADYLVSLNRKHLLGNERAQSSVRARIITPKKLIEGLGL
ncbi:putative toxin-antitoxin system toxin component, PIN family [Candidatus Uhrbacteria bacterium RIFCSPHIGHO2_12_FULL_54_23]|uniref:Putative toxin-antitoxin system toxin component, PIN family n=2 Tax=Candidatus Uhriibacteriota TaxID=1752732 RepID=A0A1F7UKA4_9BACT|nr:MAG: putative toxin-antitoxin system toxin component, PIN family [Candidatus Uhrbacteria bacterium RIFCSPHIGHO2_12_FULL_54_23]OGL90708.1 MAG: putative toxin-antitoxin system toxin component, PIN family [Candidatus Uhrbacteria bacterium RIFCSPLOWO2_02_FULL_54_37]